MKALILAAALLLPFSAQAAGDGVITFCNCVDNNGPDLVIKALDTRNGQELWTHRITGWQNSELNWRLCWQRLELVCKTLR